MLTIVERRSSRVVAWQIVRERNLEVVQALIDAAPQAGLYYSDLYAVYRSALYTPGLHTPMPDKSETFRVEGVNAEFRHYLACLARRTRCFPRCLNRRQDYHLRYPKYPAHVKDFIYP